MDYIIVSYLISLPCPEMEALAFGLRYYMIMPLPMGLKPMNQERTFFLKQKLVKMLKCCSEAPCSVESSTITVGYANTFATSLAISSFIIFLGLEVGGPLL